MKKTVFIKNAAVLTASSLILRFAGIIFKIWLASGIGSEGIGLYQLVFSVYMLAATFATSGISTSVTRLVADELALGCKKGTQKILFRSIQLTLIIAAASAALLCFGADFIAERFLSDARATASIRVLAFSLPFMGIASCLRGYFIARRRAEPSAVAQLLEQTVRILLVILLVKKFASKGLSFCCAAVFIGDTAAEIIAALLLYILYLKDRRKLSSLSGRRRPPYGIVKEITRISLPITAGRYLNTGLRTIENVLVPKFLSLYPLSGGSALSQFGMIKGMALPILFFPSALLGSLSTLLIPEMSSAAACGRRTLVRDTASRILRLTALTSFIFAAIFLVAGASIGKLIYKSDDVGFLLCALSPIVPLMYLDSVSDGILKGLDQQVFSFRTAVGDSALRILLLIPILPNFGIIGFIGIMYVSNLLTCGLNVGRLIKVSGAKIGFIKTILLPVCGALSITLLIDTLLSLFSGLPLLVYIILLCIASIPPYIAILALCGSISRDDLKF